MRKLSALFRALSVVFVASSSLSLLTGCGAAGKASPPPPAAPTVNISANPTAVAPGSSATLTVSATNATQVVISDNVDKTTYMLPGSGGTQSVAPSATATYTATATGAGGTASATALVTVSVSAPTVAITANPTTVAPGSPATLTVSAANATQVVISDNIDRTTYTLPGAGGTQSVTPSATTTYTATATGAGGTASATVVVTVSASAPTVTITANPTTIAKGSSSTLTVTATNATQVVISDNVDQTTYTLPGAGGTQAVSPSATTTYKATATGAGGAASATVTVTVNGPPTVTLTANPASVHQGSSSTLTATAANATQVVISDNVDSTTYTLPGTGGTQAVTPNTTTTYTATATGPGGTAKATATVTVTTLPPPSVTITASPSSIVQGNSSTLTVTAQNANQVVISDNEDNNTYTLAGTGGTQSVTPSATTTYTATATGGGGTATATTVVTVNPVGSFKAVNHVIFLLQENRSFDSYFGMLNAYRQANHWNVGDDGNIYNVDGIDDKLASIFNQDDEGQSYSLFHTASSCLDDMSSAWLESYGDVSRYDFSTTRSILMDGFVHTAEGYAKSGGGSGQFTDLTGRRAMAYYQDSFSGTAQLNYYYWMASQFAISDRWFSPVSSKSTPNRLATLTGGTTQGLVHDPFVDDKLPGPLLDETIFRELDAASPPVTWKIYYTVTQGLCNETNSDCGPSTGNSLLPAITFSDFSDSSKYLYDNPTNQPCSPPTVASSAVGDTSNSFCIDPTHIAPLNQFFKDLASGRLASFSYIDPGYGVNDEHPGSGQSIFAGQAQVAQLINAFMASPSWTDSVFFVSYDEGGGPYDHVPPVPGHSNDKTIMSDMGYLPLGNVPDIKSIAVNPDTHNPCVPTNTTKANCDLLSTDPGTQSTDAPAVYGFAAQLGFRLPNLVISPFSRKHYVSHVPMDHTAVIKFVETRFIGPSAHLTNRDAAQPDLLDFFDFTNVPWKTPPASSSIPVPASVGNTCTPASM